MRYIMRATGLGLVVLLLCATAPLAATFYVATNGNDSNSGSSSQPWRTLQKAANTVRAGDVVLVANGSYTGFQITADGFDECTQLQCINIFTAHVFRM